MTKFQVNEEKKRDVDMSNLKAEIASIVNEIWYKYDKDRNNYLDRNETNILVKDMMKMIDESVELTPLQFDYVFKTFDKNGNGMISKSEMAAFFKMLAGYDDDYKKRKDLDVNQLQKKKEMISDEESEEEIYDEFDFADQKDKDLLVTDQTNTVVKESKIKVTSNQEESKTI